MDIQQKMSERARRNRPMTIRLANEFFTELKEKELSDLIYEDVEKMKKIINMFNGPQDPLFDDKVFSRYKKSLSAEQRAEYEALRFKALASPLTRISYGNTD